MTGYFYDGFLVVTFCRGEVNDGRRWIIHLVKENVGSVDSVNLRSSLLTIGLVHHHYMHC